MSTRLYVEFSETKYVDQVLFLEEGTYDKYLGFSEQSVFNEGSSAERIGKIRDTLRNDTEFVEFSKSFYQKHKVEDLS